MLAGAFAAYVAVMAAAPFSLSVDNRVGKKAYVAAEISSYASMPAPGVRVGWFLSPDTVLSLAHAAVTAEQAGKKHSGAATDVGYKSFFSNSLYAEAGLNHQVWTVSDDDYTRTSATFQVGNQWQWRTFTAGCDWIGYMVPLAGSAPVANDALARFRFVRAYAGYSF